MKILIENFKLMWSLFTQTFNAIGEFFYRHEAHNVISREGMVLLSDKDETEKVLTALRSGKSEIETKYGTMKW